MSKVRLMLVDDNHDLRRLVAEYFSRQDGVEIVGMAANGLEALSIMETAQPDVIVLDIIMPQMDGYAMLEQMQTLRLEKKPEVIVLTALGRDDFITRAMSFGVRYYMVKPFDYAVLYQRILEIAEAPVPMVHVTQQPIAASRSPDERVASLFLTIGIPAHIKGYHYLREAVKMVLDTPDVINRITKELYPGIARRFGTSASKVERAIRHAIEVAWNRGRLETINQVFGYRVFTEDDKPTNGEFIALVADKLAIERSA